MTLTRRSIPAELHQATRFSDDAELASPFTLVSMIKGMPSMYAALEAAGSKKYRWGKDRMPGNWALAYLCFVISRIPDVQPWHQRVKDEVEFWTECGFTQEIPSYRLTHLRFAELERSAPALEAIAAGLMQKAKQKDARVGAWWHVDSTEAETHAAPQHDCRVGDPCPTANAKGLGRLNTQLVRAFRHKHAAEPADKDEAQLNFEGYSELKVEDEHPDEDRHGKRFRLGEHWWFSRDLDAGTRAYTRGDKVKRVWHGYYLVEVIDHFTHAPLSSTLINASRQESDAYPEVFDRTTGHLGDIKPLAVAGDRGFSLPKIFAFNTDRGVASVFPYRRQNGSEPKRREATGLYNEGGIPRCRYCKGDTHMDSFALDRGKGRLWVKCKLPQTPHCQKRQTLSCSANYRVLLPLWRDEEAYAALRVSHQNYEHKHRDLRIQYLLGPDCLALRPKRPGIRCQQLRANAALIIEWLRVLLRWGQLPGVAAVTKTSDNGLTERMRQLRAQRQDAATQKRLQSGRPGPLQLAPG